MMGPSLLPARDSKSLRATAWHVIYGCKYRFINFHAAFGHTDCLARIDTKGGAQFYQELRLEMSNFGTALGFATRLRRHEQQALIAFLSKLALVM